MRRAKKSDEANGPGCFALPFFFFDSVLGGASFINDSAACSDLNRRTSNNAFVRASTSGEGVNLETGSSAGHTTIVILPFISPTFFIFGVRAKFGQHMSEGMSMTG